MYANFNCAMGMHFNYGIGEPSTLFTRMYTDTSNEHHLELNEYLLHMA